MKPILLSLVILVVSTTRSFAQSKFSIAPTYWLSYGIYAYQSHSNYSGLDLDLAGHDVGSSAGLTARYHLTPKWNLSVGLLYNWNTSRLNDSPNIIGNRPFSSEAIQLPVLANYRLTAHRLSPYFSAGAFFLKSKTFTEAPIKVNGVVGVGLDYRIRSGLSVLVQPTVSYLFYKPADDLYIHYAKYSSYSIGVQTQLIWHF